MGIFNIKSLKDKYAWGSSEDKTNSAETAEEHPATPASSSANIADGVRSLIKSNPELAGKNRRGVASRTITPDGSLREAIEDYEVRSPAEVANQEVTPEEELSADGTATVSAQPLTHTDIEYPRRHPRRRRQDHRYSIIRVVPQRAHGRCRRARRPRRSQQPERRKRTILPATNTRSERTPLFKLSPKPSTVPAARAATVPSKLSSSAPAILPAAHPARSSPSTLLPSTVWKTSGSSPAQAPAPSSPRRLRTRS